MVRAFGNGPRSFAWAIEIALYAATAWYAWQGDARAFPAMVLGVAVDVINWTSWPGGRAYVASLAGGERGLLIVFICLMAFVLAALGHMANSGVLSW
jgi:hypothetical protein